MNPFVGTTKELLLPSQLQDLIKKIAEESSYYFFRWTHKVSGFIEQQPTDNDFPMLEGQMFNSNCELRWKYQRNNVYEVLLLSIVNIDSSLTSDFNFTEIGNGWKIEPNNKEKFPNNAYLAYGYRHKETRFPNEFIYPDSLDVRHNEENKNQQKNKPKLAQRYFIDEKTSAVQFVALTVTSTFTSVNKSQK